jgi:hypothetical protein
MLMHEHVAAELSVRLAALEVAGTPRTAQGAVRWLRLRAENGPAVALESVAAAAFALTDEWCLDAVADGDAAGFVTTACAASELFEFCLSARLVADRS